MKNKIKSEDIRHRHGVHWFMVPGFTLWMPGLLYLLAFKASLTIPVGEVDVPVRIFYSSRQEDVTFFNSVNTRRTAVSTSITLPGSLNEVHDKNGHANLSIHQAFVFSNQDIKPFVWFIPWLVSFRRHAATAALYAAFDLRTQKDTAV